MTAALTVFLVELDYGYDGSKIDAVYGSLDDALLHAGAVAAEHGDWYLTPWERDDDFDTEGGWFAAVLHDVIAVWSCQEKLTNAELAALGTFPRPGHRFAPARSASCEVTVVEVKVR